jgi:hypothetical protein
MWFKEHVYLASWISPIIAVIAIILKLRKPDPGGKPTNWTRMLLMILCLTSFPVAVTPTFDSSARDFAKYVFSFTLVAVVVMRGE